MTPKISVITAIIGAALVFAAPAAWGDRWFDDQQQAGVRVSPDLADRVVAARQSELSKMLDAREQALGAKSDTSIVSPLDQRERAFAAKREAQLASAVTAGSPIRNPVGDDRFRIDYSDVPVPVLATSSGRQTEWSQIGFGLGLGVLLMLGVYLAVRYIRIRPLAH